MKKRRSDIRKLISAARQIWRQSEVCYQLAKEAKDINKQGYFICAICCGSWPVEFMKKDHIKPIGKEPTVLSEFGKWLLRLNCPIKNLQAICGDCHKAKTREERRAKSES